MSYDTPQKETYVFPSSAFGATTESRKIVGPKGKKGIVRDIRTYLTADAVGTSTVPEITVGSAASDAGSIYAEYARHRLGTAVGTGNTAAGTPYRARALCAAAQGNNGSGHPALSDFTAHVQLETAPIPADTDFYISRVKGAGGSPAGTGITEVEIDWF